MVQIFLDANYFIDLIERRRPVNVSDFQSRMLFLSPLSVHIYLYLYRIKLPDLKFSRNLKYFNLIPLDKKIVDLSMDGPTPDFEDNIQLHSAARAECDHFLTHDKNLLDLRFFGKTKIANSIS